MKPFALMNLALKYVTSQFNGYSTMQELDRRLQGLITPDIEGVPVNSIGDVNVFHDGYGNILIKITTLESQVEIGGTTTAYIRNQAGVLQYSVDGSTWNNFGNMETMDYDADEDGIVDNAAQLNDGEHTATAEDIRDHLDNTALHNTATTLDDGAGNVCTAAEVYDHLHSVSLHVGAFGSSGPDLYNQFLALSALQTTRQYLIHGWSDSFFSGDFIDPASDEYFLASGKIKNLGEVAAWDSGLAPDSFGTNGFFGSAWQFRSWIPNAQIVAGASKIKIQFVLGFHSHLIYVGHVGASPEDFDGNQVQVFKDAAATIDARTAAVWSDLIDFVLDPDKDLLIAAQMTDEWGAFVSHALSGYAGYNGGGLASDTDFSGGNYAANTVYHACKINVLSNGLMCLIFLPYTAPSVPNAGRCLMHVHPIEEITPGVDVRVYQAADNTSPSWEEFGTIDAQELADGTVLLDMQADFVASGTTPTLKVETPTGKEIEILAIEHLFTL